MKKTITIAVLAALPLFMTSCKKDATGSKNSTVEVKEDDANAVIDFNNKFLKQYKSRTSSIESIIKYTNDAVKKSGGGDVLIMSMVSPSFESPMDKIESVPAGFGKVKGDIEKDFKIFSDTSAAIKGKYEELKSYMSAEDYKDDKGAKAKKIQTEIEATAKDFVDAAERILVKIKPAADAAEEITLKDHPLKKYILSSKSMLNSIDNSYEAFNKQYTDGKYNEAESQKAYDEVNKLWEANKALKFETSDAQSKYKGTSYDNLNKNVGNYMDNLRKLMRDAKGSGKISDSDMRTLDNYYDSIISSYNTFVN